MRTSLPLVVCSLVAWALFACGDDKPASEDLGGGGGTAGNPAAGGGGTAGSTAQGGQNTGGRGGHGAAGAGEAGEGAAGAETGGESGGPSQGGDGGAGPAGAAGEGGVGPIGVCGDDTLDPNEACDDGGELDGDGCSRLCAIEYVLNYGHIDLFELTYDQTSDELSLQVKDSTEIYSLDVSFRAPETVTIDIDESLAMLEVPGGLGSEWAFLGEEGTTVYYLDMSQQDGLPWPGWNTERLLDSLPADMEVGEGTVVALDVDIEGPGDVFTWMTDPGGAPTSRYIDTSDDAPDVIFANAYSHVHTSWAFSALGDYHLTVTPSLTTVNAGILTGRAARYRIHVGAPLVPVEPEPSLLIAGGTRPNEPETEYRVGETVTLTVSLEPPAARARFDWYRWNDGYEPLSSEHGVSFSFPAETTGSSVYYVTALGRTGRILALGLAAVVVSE